MCGRITLLTADELIEVVGAIRRKQETRLDTRAHESRPRGQARVGSQVDAIVRMGHSVNTERLTWGIKPEWANNPVFNTRIETALGRGGMWQRAIREGRCILPAATFFEPHATEIERNPKTGRSVKRSYEFQLPDEEPLLLASVQDEGQISVVTTEPNTDMAPIHPRMPLILRFDEVPLWLEGDLGDIAQLADRTHVRLHSAPELRNAYSEASAQAARSTEPNQLSLF